MKFLFLILTVIGHSMLCNYNSKLCLIVTFNSRVYTEPIIGELIPPLLPSQRAGKGACDITGRDPKSSLISNTVFLLAHMNSIYSKNIGFKQIFRHDHNEKPL